MKNWCMIFTLCFAALPAMAQGPVNVGGLYVSDGRAMHDGGSYEVLSQKVKRMELIHDGDVPFPFDWRTEDERYRDQKAINIFYTARNVYAKNPNNFAAAYNYAVLIMKNSVSEGLWLWDALADEAYAILEKADEINPGYLPLYRQQIFTRHYRIFGEEWIGPGLTEEEYLEGYRQNPDLARAMLKRYEILFEADGLSSYFDYQEPYLICTALKRTEQGAKYKTALEKLEKQAAAQEEAAREAAQELQKETLRKILYNASFTGRY